MNSRAKQLQAQAESKFSAFMGVENPNEFIQPTRGYSRMDGAVNQNFNVKPIMLRISNTDETKTLLAPIFGFNEDYAIPFNGVADIDGNVSATGKGIVIEVVGDSLKALNRRSSTNPFTVTGARYTFGDARQIGLSWRIQKKEGSYKNQDDYYPSIDQELTNLVNDKLETKRFAMSVDQNTTLFLPVAPAISSTVARTIEVVLFVGAQTNLSDALKGKSVISVYESNR